MKHVTALLLLLALVGCASQPQVEKPRVSERVILLPSQDDRPSAVTVTRGGEQLDLDQPYASAAARGAVLSSETASAGEVQQRYGELLAAQPHASRNFIMYFLLGSDELTPASKLAFDDARRLIAAWSAADVVVIGHTDRLGAYEYNDTLSRQRAHVIAQRLISAGVPSEDIQVAARGEREPMIRTADNVAEPRNRRVEIKVR